MEKTFNSDELLFVRHKETKRMRSSVTVFFSGYIKSHRHFFKEDFSSTKNKTLYFLNYFLLY